MKRVEWAEEPEGFRAWRTANPNATWDECKNEPGITQEVFEVLAKNQGQLCAYCELLLLPKLDAEVEYVYPKERSSEAYNYHLDFKNMLAACRGGTVKYTNEELRRGVVESAKTRLDQLQNAGFLTTPRFIPPPKQNQHCGSAKGKNLLYADPADASSLDQILDPRKIPDDPCLWTISPDEGELEPDPKRCQQAGIDPEIARKTVQKLGLNCVVLKRARLEILNWLDAQLLASPENEAITIENLRAEWLSPGEAGQLVPFWSTFRAHLLPRH